MKEKRARLGKIKVKLKKFYELFRGAKRGAASGMRHVAGNERKILHSRHRRVKKTKASPDDLPLFQSLYFMFFFFLAQNVVVVGGVVAVVSFVSAAATKLPSRARTCRRLETLCSRLLR